VSTAGTLFPDEFVPELRSRSLVRHYGSEAVGWSDTGASPVLLDQIAAVVAQIVDGEATVGDLAQDVHAVLGVGRGIAAAQIRRALAQLDEGELLQTSSVTAARPDVLDLFPFPPNT
jgi:hypothetical protein